MKLFTQCLHIKVSAPIDYKGLNSFEMYHDLHVSIIVLALQISLGFTVP